MERIPCEGWLNGEGKTGIHYDDFVETKQDNRFHIGQVYEDEACKTYYCKQCGGNKFYVGAGSCFTAIKCVVCDWEMCVHDG